MAYVNKAVQALQKKGYNVRVFLEFEYIGLKGCDTDDCEFYTDDGKNPVFSVTKELNKGEKIPKNVTNLRVNRVQLLALLDDPRPVLKGEGGGHLFIYPDYTVEAIPEEQCSNEMLKTVLDAGYKYKETVDGKKVPKETQSL